MFNSHCCARASPQPTRRPTEVLAIRCQFLNGTYQAAAPGRIGEPEWPPHPARLQAALIAAGWAIGGDEFFAEALEALEWLEQLPPPALDYPHAGSRSQPLVFVPRNLTSAEIGDVMSSMRAGRDASRQSGRVSRRFPTTIPGDDPVWFIWNGAGDQHVDTLTRLAREVAYVGSSRSPVCCDVVIDQAHIPEPKIAPTTEGGALALRVARNGFTAGLLAARDMQTPPTHGALLPYTGLPPAHPSEPRFAGPFDELITHALDGSFPLTVLHAPLVARAMREAVLAHAGDDAPAILHGHGRNPHIAFLPLVNVGHAHANGQIVGIAVAVPRDASDAERDAILAATGSIDELHNLGVGSWKLLPASKRQIKALAPVRWIGPARRWQTVTPVILDRYPKRRSDEALDTAIRDTLTHAGVPSPVQIRCSPMPSQAAAVPAPAYTGNDLPDGLRLHVDITFDQPMRGPLLAGRGRYFGVGLFAALSESRKSRDRG